MNNLVLAVGVTGVAAILLLVIQMVRNVWSQRRRIAVSVFGFVAVAVSLLLFINAPLYCKAVGCGSNFETYVSLEKIKATDYPIAIRVCLDKLERSCVNETLNQAPTTKTTAADVRNDKFRFTTGEPVGTEGAFAATLADAYLVSYPTIKDRKHSVKVSVSQPDAISLAYDEERSVELDKFSPNGDDCGPICWSGSETFIPQ